MSSHWSEKARQGPMKGFYILVIVALPTILAAAIQFYTGSATSNAIFGLAISDYSVALVSALAIMLSLGGALLLASNYSLSESGHVAYLILAAGTLFSLCIWIALLYENREDLDQVLEVHVASVANTISQDFDEREKMLRRMVRRWQTTGGTPESNWRADALEYVHDKPGFQAIEWITRDFQIAWIVPLAGNEAALGLELCFEERRCEALRAAQARGKTSVSQSIDLVQGGKGFLVYEPIFVDGEFDGFIAAVFRIDALMDELLRGFPDNLNVELSEMVDGTLTELYTRKKSDSTNSHLAAVTSVPLANNFWNIEITPSQRFLDANNSPFPSMLLLLCLMLTAFLTASTHFGRIARHREIMLARGKVEHALVMNNVPAIIAYYNKYLRFRIVNQRFATYFGGAAEDYLGMHARDVLGESVYNNSRPYIERALAGEDVKHELQIRGHDGDLRWFSVQYVPERNELGEVQGIFAQLHDIQNERMVQAALRESEQRFKRASEGSSDGLWDWYDVTKDEVWWSPRFYELLGYTPNSIKSSVTMFNELLHPEDRERMAINTAALQNGEEPPEPMEYRMRMSNGEYRWFRTRSKQFVDPATGLRRIAGSIQDVHDEKLAKDTLAETEERLRIAVEGSSDGLWDWYDVTQDNEWWSPSFYRLLGYEPGEIPSTVEYFSELLHPDDREMTFAAVDANLNEGIAFDVEYRLRRKSGEYSWFRARANIHVDEKTGIKRLAGSLQDISDRKLAEEALADSEQRWRLAAAGSTDGMWDWNVTTGEVWYATRWKSQLGYEENEIPHTFAAFEERLHPDDRERVLAAARAHLEQREIFDIEYRMRAKSGEYFWHRARGQALYDEKGVAFRMAGSNQDISAEKAADARATDYMKRLATANAKLRQRNQELDEFTYIASHDLQEPLRKLSNFAELLQHDVPAEHLNEDALFDLKTIQSAAARMRTLVQDLLELTRSGRRDMEMQDLPLDQCLDRALEALSLRIDEKGARITRTALPQIRGDLTLLTQVFQNLLSNALKFSTGPEPEITVSAVAKEGVWIISVADHGIGIEEQYRKQVFAPFKRLHGRDQFEGTGIGLTICRKIIGRHGGKIWLEETPGGGTTFLFSLSGPNSTSMEQAV